MPLTDCFYIEAKIRLKKTSEGGRQSGVKTGYRPNHVFEYYDDSVIRTFVGEIQFEKGRTIELGEEAIVSVCFLPVDTILKYLTVGRHWFIHEGGRLVGEADILKIQ
jgi:translation elongation factor EF-Tu-like GTPase